MSTIGGSISEIGDQFRLQQQRVASKEVALMRRASSFEANTIFDLGYNVFLMLIRFMLNSGALISAATVRNQDTSLIPASSSIPERKNARDTTRAKGDESRGKKAASGQSRSTSK